jgi:hypothetical protein
MIGDDDDFPPAAESGTTSVKSETTDTTDMPAEHPADDELHDGDSGDGEPLDEPVD